MSLKSSNIQILYNTKKKLYLKKKDYTSSENSGDLLKQIITNKQRNAIKSFDINDLEKKFIQLEKKAN